MITDTHDSDALKVVRGYEQGHKGRSTVISAAERKLANVDS